MTGRHEFCEVYFTEAATPADHVIGEPGQGWAAAVKMLEFERSDQSFTDHTRLLALLDALAPGVAPAADPLAGDARQQFVSLWSRAQLLRATNLAAARTVAAGGGVSSRGSIVKLSWSELLRDIAGFGDDLASTHPSAAPSAAPGIDAGTGPSSDPGSAELWRELYLETRSATVYSGTSEIQRDIIAQRLAGMPHR
jgi:alkylation response protein AidB-like acyl-CoA dehydrogenase